MRGGGLIMFIGSTNGSTCQPLPHPLNALLGTRKEHGIGKRVTQNICVI